MLKESVAARYSAALFGLAKERGEVKQTTEQIDALAAAIGKDPELGAFFASPVVDRTLKQDIVAKALGKKAGELVRNFVLLLVRKRRERLLDIIATQLHDLRDRDAGRQNADIATATPLSKRELEAMTRRLSAIHGRTIVAQHRVDADLLGGAVVKVGDRYTDGSIAFKLEELRRQLLAVDQTIGATSPNGKATP